MLALDVVINLRLINGEKGFLKVLRVLLLLLFRLAPLILLSQLGQVAKRLENLRCVHLL